MLLHQLQALVFFGRIATVGLQHQRDRSQRVTALVFHSCADAQQKLETVAVQRLRGTHDDASFEAGARRPKLARGVQLSLQTRPVEGVLCVLCPEIEQHRDDLVTPEIRRVAHRRAPVAANTSCILVQKVGILRDEVADGINIVLPDRIDQSAGQHQALPTVNAVAARKCPLGIGQLCLSRSCRVKAVLLYERHRLRLVRIEIAQQVFRLPAELSEIGANGQFAKRHDGPPINTRIRGRARRFVGTGNRSIQVDSVLTADGRRPVRQSRA